MLVPGLGASRKSAKLSVSESPNFGESVDLQIVAPHSDVNIPSQPARVSHVCRRKPGEWIVVCTLSASMPEEVFKWLAVSGHIEQRQEPRYRLQCEVTARWPLETASFAVELRDYSRSGFCIAISPSTQVRDRILIQLGSGDDAVTLCGRVQRQVHNQDAVIIGCSHNGIDDFRTLSALARRLSAATAQPAASHVSSIPVRLQWLSWLRTRCSKRLLAALVVLIVLTTVVLGSVLYSRPRPGYEQERRRNEIVFSRSCELFLPSDSRGRRRDTTATANVGGYFRSALSLC